MDFQDLSAKNGGFEGQGHRSHDMAHVQWLQTHCHWYPMGAAR